MRFDNKKSTFAIDKVNDTLKQLSVPTANNDSNVTIMMRNI